MKKMTMFVQALNRERKSIYLENFEKKSLSYLILRFIVQTITTTPDIRYDIGRMQNILDFQVMSKSTLCKSFKKLGCCYKWHHKIVDQRV